jgi:hypothetical protein
MTVSPVALFRLGFYTSLLAIGLLAAILIMSAGTALPGEANYVKTSVTGSGDGSSLHEGRLGEETSFKNGTIDYRYSKVWDTPETVEAQDSEFSLVTEGRSYWNKYRTWTDKRIAGSHEMEIRVSSIEGSFYAKNGMNITLNEADGTEEFVSTLLLDTMQGNATISIDVIRWEGAAYGGVSQNDTNETKLGETVGKPVTLEELDYVGKFVIEQVVELKEPLKEPGDWLGLCASLDDKLPDGYIVRPSGMRWQNGTTWDYSNITVQQVDA